MSKSNNNFKLGGTDSTLKTWKIQKTLENCIVFIAQCNIYITATCILCNGWLNVEYGLRRLVVNRIAWWEPKNGLFGRQAVVGWR